MIESDSVARVLLVTVFSIAATAAVIAGLALARAADRLAGRREIPRCTSCEVANA